MSKINFETISIDTLILGSVRTNTYIVSNLQTKQAIIFDPADHADSIIQFLEKEELTLEGIVLTHGHFDHIMAVGELVDHYKVKVYGEKHEEALAADYRLNYGSNVGVECSVKLDVLLEDGERFQLAGIEIKTIHTPGHTSGSTCYYFEQDQVLISGDTLFYESIGRTDLATGDTNAIIISIKDKLFTLDEKVKVFPGHGKPTSIGYEKLHNVYVN